MRNFPTCGTNATDERITLSSGACDRTRTVARPNFAIRLPGSCGHLSASLPALDCPHRSFAVALRAYESVNESPQRRGRRFMVSPVSGAPACPLTAFASFAQQRVGAVLVGTSNFYNGHTAHLAALATRHALPAIFPFREYALAGGLISYGGSPGYAYHQLGIYTERIFRNQPSYRCSRSRKLISSLTSRPPRRSA
jgi:hypothetical protein